MKDNKTKVEKETVMTVMSNLVTLVVMVLLLELCGCDVCAFAGKVVGEFVNAYKQTTSEIHPSDVR